MAIKRKAPIGRKTTKRRATSYKKRPMRSLTPADGQNLLVSSYFEVDATQAAANAQGGVMGYSIKVDPLDAKIVHGSNPSPGGAPIAMAVKDGDNGALTNGTLSFSRLDAFTSLFRQYKVNSITVKVTTDRECGLDNPIIMLTDRGSSAAVTSVATAKAQAHKSLICTESRRTMQYGWKPHTTEDREYHMVSDKWADGKCYYIKVLQELEGKLNGVCKHRVEIVASVTLKDSKSGN